MSLRRRMRLIVLAVPFLVLAACTGTPAHHPRSGAAVPSGAAVRSGAPTSPPARICGSSLLDSPWHYDGAAGTYKTSGTPAGLPTFGSAGTDFPGATQVMVVPAGDNTTAGGTGIYQVTNTIVYFEPGLHTIFNGMYAGNHTAYVGGYDAAHGKAIIDGHGGGGLADELSADPGVGNNVYNTWEYLTIQNMASSHQDSIMGDVNQGASGLGAAYGDTYKYDTIGPNEYGYQGDGQPPLTGESNGGGYAIAGGAYTVIEYNCLTHNAQGAFNIGGHYAVGTVIADNEISWNGLGSYPEANGTGASPYACGCSGGGKEFFTVNSDVVNNWVHDNYSAGIWFDFNNTGALISGNYINSNFADGIFYEASYNANISDNTLVGNGWASDGSWPPGYNGGTCDGRLPCQVGDGALTGYGGGNPYGDIQLNNSGGDSALNAVSVPSPVIVPGCSSNPCTVHSRYSGHIYVTGNTITNSFGGIYVYTDTNRFPDDLANDSACSTPLGSLDQNNNSTYYQNVNFLVTNPTNLYSGGDATISGSTVTSAAGTYTECSGYGQNTGGEDQAQQFTRQAPSVGMAVYNVNTGAYLGDVASVTSATRFTLNDSRGKASRVTLLVSQYGGCAPADYVGGGPGVASGKPSAHYWDHCIWGARNITVSHNTLGMDASKVTGCTNSANLCGYIVAMAYRAGAPTLSQYWQTGYVNGIALANGARSLGNIWSGNSYHWTGGGSGGWTFMAGDQGTVISRSTWQAADGQDAGSTFGP